MNDKIDQSKQQIKNELLQLGAMLYDITQEQKRLKKRVNDLKVSLATLEHVTDENNNNKTG